LTVGFNINVKNKFRTNLSRAGRSGALAGRSGALAGRSGALSREKWRSGREKWRSSREKWRSPVISATVRQGLGMAMNSYFSTSHRKPGIVVALSSATSWIRTHQEPAIPESWITRMMLTPFCRQPTRRVQGSSHQLCKRIHYS
jgi:hypothetical protein